MISFYTHLFSDVSRPLLIHVFFVNCLEETQVSDCQKLRNSSGGKISLKKVLILTNETVSCKKCRNLPLVLKEKLFGNSRFIFGNYGTLRLKEHFTFSIWKLSGNCSFTFNFQLENHGKLRYFLAVVSLFPRSHYLESTLVMSKHWKSFKNIISKRSRGNRKKA